MKLIYSAGKICMRAAELCDCACLITLLVKSSIRKQWAMSGSGRMRNFKQADHCAEV